jgi:hypothetical protein
MKFFKFGSIFLLAALILTSTTFALGARHHRHSHLSLNFGPVFAIQPRPYIVERGPTYVEKHVYMDSYGYPYNERVYVHPAPHTYVYPARPVIFGGLSFGFNLF